MSQSALVFDIETIPDPDVFVPSPDEARFPSAPEHQIVSIAGFWFDESYRPRRLGIFAEDKDEAGKLQDFVRFVEDRRPLLVSYNGRGFDLPVIAARCFRHGIAFPYYYRSRDMRYRFSPDGHLDLMDFLSDFGATRNAKLDVFAKLCGMPGKVGVDGSQVHSMVLDGKIDLVNRYCACDVLQTSAVYLRLQLLRGELDLKAYRAAMEKLITFVKDDERVADVVAAWDIDRLMLSERDEPSSTNSDEEASEVSDATELD